MLANEWARLSTGTWHLVMGLPGAGKSALLRTVVLDALASDPQELGRLDRFQGILPLWLPFAYWTSASKDSSVPSVLEAVRSWLNTYDHAELWPLVEKALDDERLLLVVDGLDEWATPDRARQCLDKLEVFASTKKASVLASARPFSSADLPLDQQRWRIARLAPLDSGQQLAFITRWLAPVNAQPNQQANSWMCEINDSPHLRELSDLPLFLALLLRSREQKSEFPEDMHAVLDDVVDRMIGDHRRRKVDTSHRPDQFPRPSEIRICSASVADNMHQNSLVGISDTSLRHAFRVTLTDQVGYPPETAHAMAQALVDSLSPGVGLLIRPAPDETRFFHRTVLEFLAAERLLTLHHDVQIELIRSHAADRRWSAVLGFALRGLTRPVEVGSVFDALDQAGELDPLLREAADLLAADVAVSPGCIDALTRRKLLSRVARAIESGDRLTHRLQLLSRLTPGLSRPEARDFLLVQFAVWLESSALTSSAWALEPLVDWPAEKDTQELLWCAMHEDDGAVQRTAARLLGTLFASDDAVRQRLVVLADSTLCYARRAAAIEALSTGWPDDACLEDLIREGIEHPDYAVRRASVSADLRRKDHADHRGRLIELARMAPRRSAWADGVVEEIFENYPDDQTVFEAFNAAADPAQHEQFPSDEEKTALHVILQGYPKRPEARRYLLFLLSPEHPRSGSGLLVDDLPWRQLAEAHQHDANVVAAIEDYVRALDHSGPRDLYFCSLVARTTWVRDQIVAKLTSFGGGWGIKALIERWPDDEIARAALRDLVRSDAVPDGAIAFLPEIIADPTEALDLLAMLAPTASDQAAVIEALGVLSQRLHDPDSRVESLLSQALAKAERTWLSDPEASAIFHFPADPGVRRAAQARLTQPEAPLRSLGYGYREDTEMRHLLAGRKPLSAPLRAHLVEALAEFPVADDAVTNLLMHYRTELDPTVRLIEAAAYARRLKHAADIPANAIEEFTRQARATGPRHEGHRAAAFCALTEIGRLDLLAELKEANGGPVRIQTPIANSQIFLGFLCSRWNYVKGALGVDYLTRLSDSDPAGAELLSELLAVAHDYPDTHADLTEFLRQHPERRTSAAALSFLMHTAAPELRESVYLALEGDASSIGSFYPVWMALHILTERFASDPETQEWLDKTLDSLSEDEHYMPWLSYGKAAAIARLRPDHPLIPRLVDAYRFIEGRRWRTLAHWSELGAAAAKTASELLAHAKHLARIARGNDLPAEVIHLPLTARLRKAPTLAAELSELVPRLEGTDQGIALRLLEQAGQIDGALHIHLRTVAARTSHQADATLDPLTGEACSSIALARDILDADLDLAVIARIE